MSDIQKRISANGRQLNIGDVVCKHENPTVRGVVVRTVENRNLLTLAEHDSDIGVQTSAGCTIITSNYSSWEHISKSDQTVSERFISWQVTPSDQSEEDFFVSSIMSVCDDVDDDVWPISYVDAMKVLSNQLARLKSEI